MKLADLSKPFPAREIEWRVGSTTADKKRGMALAYLTARHVMDRLDEVCGPQAWQDRYEFHGARTVCYLSIKIGDEWITKADGAGDSDVEAEKGAISDALKRAAVKWGIGRYLYDLESPWVELEEAGRSVRIKASEYAKLERLMTGATAGEVAPHVVDSTHLSTIDKAGDLTALEAAFAAAWRSTGALEDRAEFKKRYEARKLALLPPAKNLGEQLDRMAAAERVQ